MHPFEDLVVPPNAIGIHWFGQSSFALKSPSGIIVQVDPYFPRERPADRFVHARPPLHEATLRTDYILLTHNHLDHTFPESVGRIQAAYPQVRCIGPAESEEELRNAGQVVDFTVVTAGDETALGSMKAHAVWSKPPRGVAAEGIPAPDVRHLGYVIDGTAVRLYISGDPINTFAEHESLLQPIRRLKPHIGLLTTHPSEGEFPYFRGSGKMAAALGLRAAVPAHYGCFVERNYDPQEWADQLPAGGPQPLIIPYNQSAVYSV